MNTHPVTVAAHALDPRFCGIRLSCYLLQRLFTGLDVDVEEVRVQTHNCLYARSYIQFIIIIIII